MKIFFLFFFMPVLLVSTAYCQQSDEILQKASILTNSTSLLDKNIMGGFSISGIIAGVLFSSVGFIAFVYGKKNFLFRPMLIGIVLMAYPYFIQNTIILYLIGVGLTAGLFIFRE